MKFSDYFTNDTGVEQAKELGVRGRVLKSLYKNVKIPWLLIIVGAILAVFNSIVILTQYENYMAIFTGALNDLSPLWQYLAASFVQYLLIFASVLADVAYVTIVTRVRKKMWRKMVHLPLKSFEEETPSGMLSRVTSDAEYASKPFAAAIAVLQILLYILSLSAAAPKDMPQALGFLIVTLILAVASIVVSVKICSKATTCVQSRISALTAHYSEQLSSIKFVKASNAEEKAVERTDREALPRRTVQRLRHRIADPGQQLCLHHHLQLRFLGRHPRDPCRGDLRHDAHQRRLRFRHGA